MDDLLRDPVRGQHARPAQDLTPRRLLAALAALALALGGCADDETDSAAGGDATPGAGGAIAWALAERPASLDPLFAVSAGEQLLSRQIHEPLIAELAGPFDGARRAGGLALSARPSANETVWTLRLRPGVRFEDGTIFNGAAVLANARRWSESEVARELLGDFLFDAPRPGRVRFILPAPSPDFAERLASPRLGLVSPRVLARAGGGEVSPALIGRSGTGPFGLRERSAERLLLARNTEWWGTERGLGPAVDQIEFSVVAEPEQRLAALAAGEVQVASELGPAELAAARDDPLLTVEPLGGGRPLALERSVRGIPPGEPVPPLNGVWRTGIEAGP